MPINETYGNPDYNKMEKRQAKLDGAKVVPNSGRNFRKGDAILEDMMIDYKFVGGKSFSVNIEKWQKHARDAWREQKVPAIIPIFDDNGVKRELAIVDWSWLKEILDDD